MEPDNVHALSNLIHFLCAAGQQAEARPYADRLKASPAPAADVWLKKIEGLSYLGDDHGVLDMFRQTGPDDRGRNLSIQRQVLSPLAVATWRLGREAEARSYWQQALKLAPDFALARENLDDLKQPPPMRDGPRDFTLHHWLSQRVILDLARSIEPEFK